MSHYNYLHGFLSWHYLDEDICSQLDTQFKRYKIKFLILGIRNDEDKKDKFIKIVNSKKMVENKVPGNCHSHFYIMIPSKIKLESLVQVIKYVPK